MMITQTQHYPISSNSDVVAARKNLQRLAKELGMSNMRETELRTAATELLTNALRYALGAVLFIEVIEHNGLRGIRATVEDSGPGIEDPERALCQGFSTGKSLGHGLSGCKNLVDSFDLKTELGKGTRVVVTKWC